MKEHKSAAAQADHVRLGRGQAECGGHGCVRGVAASSHDVIAGAGAERVIGGGHFGGMLGDMFA